jgi:hypothetical protein
MFKIPTVAHDKATVSHHTYCISCTVKILFQNTNKLIFFANFLTWKVLQLLCQTMVVLHGTMFSTCHEGHHICHQHSTIFTTCPAWQHV